MKTHKGSYVNKTNEKPELRGDGESERKGPSGIYCSREAPPFTLATGGARAAIMEALPNIFLKAEKHHTWRQSHSLLNWEKQG